MKNRTANEENTPGNLLAVLRRGFSTMGDTNSTVMGDPYYGGILSGLWRFYLQ